MTTTDRSTHETVETKPLGLLVRENARAYYTTFPYEIGTECQGESLPEARSAEFARTGDIFLSIEGENQAAVIRDGNTSHIIASCGGLDDPQTPLKVSHATFSPLGSYVLTWAKPVSGISVPNLVVYSAKTGERLASFFQKVFRSHDWPSIQWSDDESIAARSVTNNVHFFRSDAMDKSPSAVLRIPGVDTFSLSHGSAPYTIAAFIPGSGGAPGRIGTFKHPNEGGEQLASRSTFRADAVTFKWNSKGTAVLFLISTNIDTTGKSYYGESEVYFMDNLGVVDQRVGLPQEGPTFSAAWSPSGTEFIIIYGYMPARATMFNEKAEPIFDFGTGSRNEVSFSPYGRFVALAGFGNLPGNVEFWDKNKTALVGRAQLPCTTMHSWSPCSRYFLGATTFPRLRVDNGFRIVRFDGKLVHDAQMQDGHLHQAVFKPALRGTYADPKLTMNEMIGGPPEEPDSGKGGNVKKGGVYRPPGSRGSAPSIQLHQHVEAGKIDKAGFLSSGKGLSAAPPRSAGGKRVVPGMDPAMLENGPSKASLAKKKKKERARQLKLQNANDKQTADTSAAQSAAPQAENIDSIDVAEKLAKKLKKKLRTIDTLKISQTEGKHLNTEQLDKLASGSAVEEELARVEKKIVELSTK